MACDSSKYCGLLDIAHIKTRKAYPEFENERWNCPTLCRDCHIEQGTIGISSFADKYPKYKEWLISNGWGFDSFSNKWLHTDREIDDIIFSLNNHMDNAVKRRLKSYGIKYLDDFEEVNHWELFKIRSFGALKMALVEEAMKFYKIQFKDKKWMNNGLLKKRDSLLDHSPYVDTKKALI